MPFHNYSSSVIGDNRKSDSERLIVRKPNKFVPNRHSSPPVYDFFDDSVPSKAEEKATSPTYLWSRPQSSNEELSTTYFQIGKKSSEKKNGRRQSSNPIQSFSNPNYFEHSKSDPSVSRSPEYFSLTDRHNISSDSLKRPSSSLASVNKSPPSRSRPIPVTDVKGKPPIQSASPSGSPTTVRLRNKRISSPKGNPRRRGVVWDSGNNQQLAVSISSPVLISHQVTSTGGTSEGGPRVQPRNIDQQEALLQKLQLNPDSQISRNQEDSGIGSSSVGSKMADRIQRTIKALYSYSSGPRKSSFDMLEDLSPPNESKSLLGDQDDSLLGSKKASYKNSRISSGVIGESPKTDKRGNRKRSPKPGRRTNNSLQVKDVDGSRRFKWRGSVNKIVKKFGTGQPFMLGGTFGVHLEDCPPSLVNEFVPFVVELCCRIVEERGLNFTGIYRVPGNNAALTSLQDDLNQHGIESIEAEDERLRELNVVSSLLKSFFRKLPDPLFTNELYSDFIQANRRPDSRERLHCLRRLVHMLPGPHYETLKFLITHLRCVADNCATNKMEVRNLAIVFGPTLVRSTASDNMATMVTDMSDQCRIVESIIEHAEWFFVESEGVTLEALTPSGAPVDHGHEPVPGIGFLLDNVGRNPGETSGNASDSSKSKCSSDSEKDSFSRDVIDLIFGKKWKQALSRNSNKDEGHDSADDHGGFEDPHRIRAKMAENVPQQPQTEMSPAKSQGTGVASKTNPRSREMVVEDNSSSSMNSSGMDVSERLLEFYKEHLERLSKTTLSQPLPTFSSTESSPHVTPRNSNSHYFDIPLAYPRKRSVDSHLHPNVSSSSQKLDYSTQMSLPNMTSSDARLTERMKDFTKQSNLIPIQGNEPLHLRKEVPQYRHPPNPYLKPFPDNGVTATQSTPAATQLDEHKPEIDIRQRSISCDTPREHVVSTDDGHESDTSDMSIYVGDSLQEKLRNLTNLDRNLERRPSKRIANRPRPPVQEFVAVEQTQPEKYHEVLVGEPVPVRSEQLKSPFKASTKEAKGKSSSFSPRPVLRTAAKQKSPKEHEGKAVGSTSPEKSTSRKSTRELYEEKKIQRQKQKINKVKMKSNVPQHATTSDENMFSRFDPKRRVIRPTTSESDPLHSVANRSVSAPLQSSNINKTLSAQERLFEKQDPPQLEQWKKSFSRERKRQKIMRRHTLSGATDFPDHTFWNGNGPTQNPIPKQGICKQQDFPNHGYPSSTVSMCDLAFPIAQIQSAVAQVSAVDRLKPKGTTSGMTLGNWMTRERLKNTPGRRELTSRRYGDNFDLISRDWDSTLPPTQPSKSFP